MLFLNDGTGFWSLFIKIQMNRSATIAVLSLLTLVSCREEMKQAPYLKTIETSGSEGNHIDLMNDNCRIQLVLEASIRFDTPNEYPIGYLVMVRRDAVGNFVTGSYGQHVLVFDSLAQVRHFLVEPPNFIPIFRSF